jgi:hypothetical protein
MAAHRSLRRTIKDFDVVDQEERCTGAGVATWRVELRASAVPPRFRVESPVYGALSGGADPSTALGMTEMSGACGRVD